MSALDLLLQRQSQPLLKAPAPDDAAIDTLLKIALRSPDHAYLRPWRFILVRDEGLQRLGDLFVKAAVHDDPDTPAEKLEKTRGKPLRAPLIITVVANIVEHPKVPQWEQLVSAGCAANAILYGAEALGYGAIWRTGGMAESRVVAEGMGLSENEKIVGFIYLGTPATDSNRLKPVLSPVDFISEF